MKTKTFTICLLLFTSLLISNRIFAQRDSGGSSDGGLGSESGGTFNSGTQESCITQPNPTSFKRNNGQGTCGGDAQIRLSFSQQPTIAPTIIGLYHSDGTPVTNVFLPIQGDMTNLAKKGYISYCIMGSNIAPAKKLIAVFHYDGGCQADATLNEK